MGVAEVSKNNYISITFFLFADVFHYTFHFCILNSKWDKF